MSYILVERKKENLKNYIFNDIISLITDEFDAYFKGVGSVLFSQPCDSIADDWITKGYNWSKKKGDPEAYTIMPGIYTIKKSIYKKDPAIYIYRPITKWYKWTDFTLPHKIHRVNIEEKEEITYTKSKDGKLYKKGYSGGCIVLPKYKNKEDILNYIENLIYQHPYVKYPNHLKIIETV